MDVPDGRETASAVCLKPIPRELPDVRPDISLTGRIKRDGCRDCEVRVRVVSTFRVEHLRARARRLDLERLQLGHQSVTKRQVVSGDQFARLEPIRKITQEQVLRDVVIPPLRIDRRARRDRDRDMFNLLLDQEVAKGATEACCVYGYAR